MSGGTKQKQTSQQQTETTTQLPAWMTSAGQDLYNKASAQAPVGAYQGQMTAGPTQNQQQASQAARQGAGAWQQDLNQARDMTTAAATAGPGSVSTGPVRASTMQAANQGYATQTATGYQANGQAPQVSATGQTVTNATAATAAPVAGYTAAGAGGGAPQVTAGQVQGSTFDNAAAARYMNPYQQQVQQNTLREMDNKAAQDQTSLGDSVQAARAFGGTRQALLESELAKNQAQQRSDYIDSSNAAAYASAQGQFNTDRSANDALAVGNADRNLQAGTTNASLLDQLMGRIDTANRFNADATNAQSEANAGRSQQANLANAGAANTASGANADRNLDASKTNASLMDQMLGRQDEAAKFTAGAQNDAAGANAGRQQQSMGANADRQQSASQFNAGAKNDMANSNANRDLDAQKTNASMYEQMLQRLMGGGQQIAQIGEAGSNLNSRDVANLSNTGAADQATQQAGLDRAYQEYLRAGNAPLDNIKDIMAILSGAPRNVTTSGSSSGSSTTQQSSSLFNQLLGAAQVGASVFSDRRLKTDVSWIDNLPNGLGVYRYRYRWENDDTPLHIGVMADEVAKIMPEALGPTVNGFNTVDYSMIGGLLA